MVGLSQQAGKDILLGEVSGVAHPICNSSPQRALRGRFFDSKSLFDLPPAGAFWGRFLKNDGSTSSQR
jgi:hypothetical protein